MPNIEWSNVVAPLSTSRAVTPSDSTDLPDGMCRCIIVSADCLLNIHDADGVLRSSVQFFKGYNPRLVRRVKTGAGASGVTIEAGY